MCQVVFFSAYYKRLCYERDKGTLADFLSTKSRLGQFIPNIIRNQHNESDEWFDEFITWMELIESVADKGQKNIISLVAHMYFDAIKWLEQKKK